MKLRVKLGANVQNHPEQRAVKAEQLRSTESNQKVIQAKHYLLEHNLEERLSEAMQAVLREKPEDPHEFIADLLKKSAGDYKKIVPSSPKDRPYHTLPSVGPGLLPRSPRPGAGPAASPAAPMAR